MSVYDLYQSYLNQIQSPVMQSPVTDPNYLLYLQQQQGGGNDRDNITNTTTSTYDPNIGKNFYDYEADAYGIGPTIGGGIANLMTQIQNFPTPLNLARMGIQGIGNLISNIRDPYKTFTGALKPDVQEAIQRDTVREMARENERSGGGGYQAGYGGGFMGGRGTSEEMGSF